MQTLLVRPVFVALAWFAAALASAEIFKLDAFPILQPVRPSGGSSNPEERIVPPHVRLPISSDARALVAGNNQFAIDLFQRVGGGQASENMLASPLSISAALAMTYAGARGSTADQMASVLRFPFTGERTHAAFGEVIRDLDATREGYQLSIANRLFGQDGFHFEREFLDVTDRHYGAPLERLNFARDPDGSRAHINDWVEHQTNDKIKDLLPDGSVNEDTRLVLTNAIYFNGKWKYKFDESDTHDAAFYSAEGQTRVATMFQQQRFKYGDFDGFKMLEMPYAGDDLSMVLMLPDANDGIAGLEASLTSEMLDHHLQSMHERDVNVFLPKFKFEAAFKLGETLKDMEMTEPFDPELSNLTGMSQPADGNLFIDDVLHKAFIDVNEAGTEAAAGTAVIVGITSDCVCEPPPPVEFRADHPFLFALRDRHSGSLMFLGRVATPGESVIDSFASPNVPEPSTALLCLMGLAILGRSRR